MRAKVDVMEREREKISTLAYQLNKAKLSNANPFPQNLLRPRSFSLDWG